MPILQTGRLFLPMLAVGQAQKEITHNEALAMIDALISAVIEGRQPAPPPSLTENDAGKCWLVAASASGFWLAKSDQIACWTGGSWRFNVPVSGMRIWNAATNSQMIWRNNAWQESVAISDPSAGSVIDVQARSAVVAILQLLRQSGLLRV
jgi:hypothetical protein